MKAPDKIYLEMDKEIDKIHHLWGQLPVVHSGYEHIEYIRKDALLEWAEEMKEHVGLGLNAYDMGEENGKAEMLNALIDKLKSM